MKRARIILLTAIYLTATVGLAFNIHFCGGKIAVVSFIGSEKNCEGKPAKEAASDCCKDQKVEYKVKADQKTSAEAKSPSPSPVVLFHDYIFEHLLPVLKSAVIDRFFERGPPGHKASFRILYSTFRL